MSAFPLGIIASQNQAGKITDVPVVSALLGSSVNNPSGNTTTVVVDDITPPDDSLLIVWVSGGSWTTHTMTMSTTLSNVGSWTIQEVNESSGSPQKTFVVYAQITGSAGTGSITATSAGGSSSNRRTIAVAAVTGARLVAPVLQVAKANQAAGTTIAASFTNAPKSNSLILSCCVNRGNGSSATPDAPLASVFGVQYLTSSGSNLFVAKRSGTATENAWSNLPDSHANQIDIEIASVNEPWNPLTSINWAHAGWADDPDWARPADGQPVVSWRNASGGGDPTQATAGNRPTMDYDGLGGKGAVVFDGTNDSLAFDIANMGQPLTLVAVSRTAITTGNHHMIGWSNVDSGGATLFIHNGAYAIFAAATVSGGVLDLGNHLHAGVVSGGSSRRIVDGATVATGNPGSAGLTVLSIGGPFNAGPEFWQGPIAFWAVYPGDITTDPNWPVFKQWVTTYYGIATS